jgi:hypothetical protein
MFRDRFQRPLAATAICLAATALPLSAQETPAPSAQELANQKKIEELERKLAVLAEELQALRAGEKAEEAPAPAPGEPAPEGATGLAPAASKVYSKQRGVSIGGYGEMMYENYDATRDDGEPSEARDRIDLLRAVLYFGYKFDDRIVFNSEIEYEHATTDDGKGEVAVEFAYLDFLLDDAANVRAGLVLVPVGIVNQIHEPPTYLGVKRPGVDNVILPTTWSEPGVGLHGRFGLFSYEAYLLDGLDSEGFTASAGLRGGRQSGARALAEDLAVALRLDLTGIPGLLAGVSFYRGDSGQGRTVNGETIDGTVTLYDVHADWKWRGLWLRGVWSAVDIGDADLISIQNGQAIGSALRGGYGEAGYDLLSLTDARNQSLYPYVRYERYDTQAEVAPDYESSVTGADDRTAISYGVMYRPIPQVSIKAEYQDLKNAAGTGVDQFNASLGYLF